MSEQRNQAVQAMAELDLPTWDRGGDMVMQFAQDLDQRWRIAQMIAKSGMTRHRKPEAIMAIMLKAYEIGVPLMQALGAMYFVDGKVAMEGHLMDALAIDRCGVTKTVHEQTIRGCRMTLHRQGWDDLDVSYMLDDAQRAGLVQEVTDDGQLVPGRVRGKPRLNWKKHPREMYYWRALSRGLKQIAPDYFGGVYTLDELEVEAEVAERASRSGANEELDALEAGIDPDEDAMDDDEIDRMRTELRDALDLDLIDQAERKRITELALAGQWTACRGAWDQVRGKLARAKADDQQPAGEQDELPF